LKEPADLHGIKRHFQDVRALMVGVTANLAKMGGVESANLIKDISGVMQSLVSLEQTVIEQLKSGESRLGALIGVGRTINSSLGLKRVLEEVMDSLIELMSAERGFLMLRESNGELIEQVARRIDHSNFDKETIKVSQTIVKKVVESGESILTTNAQEDPRFENQMSVAAYQLRSILCAPLKIKDRLIGVIYVDNRAHAGIFRERELGLITAFSDQAAVAIDNAQLFDGLQASNKELQDAYRATLEGWVHALDMRDKETEGHTQRVTTLTERLARSMGVGDDEMVHIKRGALLHDIGKMAIPDGILLKPGPLTDDERELIKKHPVYAYEMLKQIDFLLPAIDIPHYHHEKWDGTGYPAGLRGEDIPFPARIFPVIDVYDALVSNRPYRKALPPEEVRERIKADSGKHFDPQVVDAFMQMDDMSV